MWRAVYRLTSIRYGGTYPITYPSRMQFTYSKLVYYVYCRGARQTRNETQTRSTVMRIKSLNRKATYLEAFIALIKQPSVITLEGIRSSELSGIPVEQLAKRNDELYIADSLLTD